MILFLSDLVSKAEILDCSLEASYWIKVFLTGNEPNSPVDKDGQTSFGTKKYKEWQKAVELFQETGFWDTKKTFCISCNKKMLPSEIGEICIKCTKK